MKKIFIIGIFITSLIMTNVVFGATDITGRWAEKISERVVMDIYQDNNTNDYQIFITWREDNLAQKDIYRFIGKSTDGENIKYDNGVHLYRFFNSKNNYEDKTDYTYGSGVIKIKDNELIWIVFANGSLASGSRIEFQNYLGIRPVITISKEVIDLQ